MVEYLIITLLLIVHKMYGERILKIG